ncbi:MULTISPECIES: FtsX-like permease family protein [Streptococcus]|uniref:FtsX-like permease family protein n=1 Tax=Streptococcus caledonicus TaxID=2614158 RepID=A0ABW0U993_9STRE|nr:FtsX-like permease family protein [Streptococcus sp. S784/96/1]
MKKTIYWKDIRQSFTKSKGRFFSIFALMGIGSLALIALKVTTPNMRRTAQEFIDTAHLMDLAVMADYGLDEEDVKELSALPGATIEFGYLTDVTIANSHDAIRVFSKTDKISQYQLVSGHLPHKKGEIALAEKMAEDYRLGETIYFKQSEQGHLTKTTFTVVGFVQSPEIWDNEVMGQTNSGTGELKGYAVVSEDHFDSDVYMIARISYNQLDKVAYYHNSYEEHLTKHREDLEELLADNGKKRLTTLRASAQAEIVEGYDSVYDSEQKLADAAQVISDGKRELADGQNKIDTASEEVHLGQEKLNQATDTLSEAKKALDANAAKLEQSKKELSDTKQKLEDTKLQLDRAKEELDQAKVFLDEMESRLDASQQEIASGKEELQRRQEEIYAKTDELVAAGIDPMTVGELGLAQEELARKEVELTKSESTFKESLAQYEEGKSTYENNLATYQEGMIQYESGLDAYNQGMAEYESGLKDYQSGLSEYESGYADYQIKVEQIEEARSDLSTNQEDLDKGSSALTQSEKVYNQQKSEAELKIARAREDLEEAKSDLADLKEPKYSVYTRKTLPGGEGYATYSMGADSILAVGDVFPVVLYGVAAMVTLTTMTRFVDEERQKAGIFKALGYTNRQIIAKFVIYGLVASLLGTIAGVLGGHFLLSPVIGNILTEGTIIGSSRTYFYPSWTLVAIGLALLSAVLPTYWVAKRELSEKTAYLLQAKPPVAGSKILLEKVTFIWKRLSFTHKVTARNIFRYKQRMLMTVFGVAGSVALLFAGLGIQSSISGVADTQFGEIVRYDMIVASKRSKDRLAIEKALHHSQIKQSQSVYFEALTEKIKGNDDEVSVNLLVTDSSDFSDYINLRERDSGISLSLGQSGAIITEKLAKLYGVSQGDKIKLTLADQEVTVTVSGITEMYVGQYVYMTADYYEKITDQEFKSNSYLVTLKNRVPKIVQNKAADFLAMEEVAAVAQNTALEKTLHTVANSLQSVMIILIILSVMLGVVILYNLTNINVAERIRELSTIKVLGFHNREVTLYIYRETIVLSGIGIVTGLLGGKWLHQIILNMIGSNQIMFQPKVAYYIYLVPIIAIIGILSMLGWFVNHKLRKVDMLEALKSVD